MKQQILVDMDGVLADVYAQFQKMEYNETGIKLDIESLYGKTEKEAFPHFEKHVHAIGYFRTAPRIAGSYEGLKYLNDKYKLLIVSSATEFPNSLKEKLDWLNEFYPFIGWQQMIFCGKKDAITGDIMIDDHPANLDTFAGKKILFTQPHNMFVPDDNYTRVKSWDEIMQIL